VLFILAFIHSASGGTKTLPPSVSLLVGDIIDEKRILSLPFSFAVVLRALADDNAEGLFTFTAAFKTDVIILPPPVFAYE